MTTTAAIDPQAAAPADAVGVLRAARGHREAEEQAARDLLRDVLQWASIHAVDPADPDSPEVCEHWQRGSLGSGSAWPIAGEGAPLTSEVAVAELAACLGMSTEAGKRLTGDVIELAFRLRRCWSRVASDEVPGWRARQVAELTRPLSQEAAAYVDRHVAPALGRIGRRQLERLVDEAVARFMPEEARRQEARASDSRHVSVDAEQVSFYGTVQVAAELELADAYDFESAVACGAAQLQSLGSPDTLDGRRATAVGEMARSQLALAFDDTDSASGRPAAPARIKRRLTLYVHLTDSAITGPRSCRRCGGELEVARVASMGNTLITADRVGNGQATPTRGSR